MMTYLDGKVSPSSIRSSFDHFLDRTLLKLLLRRKLLSAIMSWKSTLQTERDKSDTQLYAPDGEYNKDSETDLPFGHALSD